MNSFFGGKNPKFLHSLWQNTQLMSENKDKGRIHHHIIMVSVCIWHPRTKMEIYDSFHIQRDTELEGEEF